VTPVRSRPGRLRPVLIAAAAIAVVVVAAWVLQATVSGGGESSQGDSPPPYSVSVKRGGEVLKTYDLAALRALPQVTTEMADKEQTGPALSALLVDAGVSSYEKVDVRGTAVRDAGLLSLTRAQAERRVQLDFSERGTAKVCAPWLERKEWVRDVLTVSVE
jgi:hypothetical protein